MREHLERMPSVPRDMHLKTLHSEELTEQVPSIGVVVDNQYDLRHGRKITFRPDTWCRQRATEFFVSSEVDPKNSFVEGKG